MTRKNQSPALVGQSTASQPPPAFCVILERDADFGEQIPDHQWPSTAEAAVRALTEVREHEEVRKHWANHARPVLVLTMTVESKSPQLGVANYRALLDNMHVLLLGALTATDGIAEARELLERPDLDHGHVVATVVMVDSDATARRLCEERMKGDESDSIGGASANRLRTLLTSPLPEEYVAAYSQVVEWNELTKAEIAKRFASVLNAEIAKRPQKDHSDKQEVASWANAQVRRLGLAFKCPVTGRPGTLIADLGGTNSDISRFRLDVLDESGRHSRRFSATQLPALDLMVDVPRQEPFAGRPGRASR